MDRSQMLMLRGQVALCPDCGDDRVMVPVGEGELCCTTCDAAVFAFHTVADGSLLSRAAS